MVLDFVHQACHGHVLPKVFFDTLVPRASLIHGARLMEEARQASHISEQGVEGHHAEGRWHHAMWWWGLVRSTCPVQTRKVGGGGQVGEEGEGEALVLLCQEPG